MAGLRTDIADLLAHPGSRRSVTRSEVLDGLAAGPVRVEGEVHLDLVLERISEGVVVRGTVRADWTAPCSVCLGDLHRTAEVHVDELFEPTPVEGDTYPIEGHEIDLEQLVRDSVLLDLPLAPRCADPCADLTSSGSDADDEDDDDADERPDPRWAVLSELEI